MQRFTKAELCNKIFNQKEIQNVKTFKLYGTNSFEHKLSINSENRGKNQVCQNWQVFPNLQR